MASVVGKSRNPVVAAAFAGLRADERRMKRIALICKTKPEPTPLPAAKSKNAPLPRAKGGTTKKAKP